MEAIEQPTAPYLDAVGAYAFRGTARYRCELAATGARLHGASDPAFATIHVLLEAR